MSIIIKDLSYIHSDKEVLFSHLNLNVNPGEKIALIGNNGCGKSTLMQILYCVRGGFVHFYSVMNISPQRTQRAQRAQRV